MAFAFDCHPYLTPAIGAAAGGTRTAFALDTAFVLATSGKCIGIRFEAPVTDTIDSILFFVSAAPAVAHDLSVNVCAYGATNKPGAALANGTVAISGGTTADKWIKAVFTSKPSVVVGTAYWIVIGDAAGDVSNYSILSRGTGYSNSGRGMSISYSSTDGFATAGTNVADPSCYVIQFTSGKCVGSPYTYVATSDASANLERGIKITPAEDIVIYGLWASSWDNAANVKIYPDGQNPGGTIYSGFNGGAAFALTTSAEGVLCCNFPPCTLLGGVTYRVVSDPNGVATAPGYYSIEDDTTHSAILEAAAFPGVFAACHTEEAAGPVWTDTNSKAPRMILLIQSLPAIDTPIAGNVTEDDTVRGATGTYHEATEAEVQSGVHFGAASALTGSYSPAGGAGAASSGTMRGMAGHL